jgi:hypothetical protein
MASAAVNGTEADLAALNKTLPAAQAIAEIAVLQHLVRIFLTNIRESVLPGDGRRLEKQQRQQQKQR